MIKKKNNIKASVLCFSVRGVIMAAFVGYTLSQTLLLLHEVVVLRYIF